MASNAELIAQVYVGFYDRAPDPVGLQYWIGRLNDGVSIQDIGDSFAASPEAAATYPFFKFPGLLSPKDFLGEVYQNVFGRAIDADGLKYYMDRMEAGESAGSVVASILGNAASNAGSPDQAYLQNKVDAGLHWAMTATAHSEIYQDNGQLTASASTSAHGILDGITADKTSVDAANSATDGYFGGGAPGSTFTLTDAVGENVVGTANADTFSGIVSGASNNDGTLNMGDLVDGLGGNDTLNLLVGDASAAMPVGATIKNIETVNITYGGTGTVGALNSSSFAGAKEIWQIDNLAAAGTFQGITVGAGVTAGFRSNGSVLVNQNVTAASATQTSMSVALDGVATGSVIGFAGAGLKTIDVSGSLFNVPAVAETVTIGTSATNLDAINLSLTGDTTVVFSAGQETAEVINGAGSTGGLTIDTSFAGMNGLSLTTLTGGSGNDVLTLELQDLKAATATIDGGAGNDTINVVLDNVGGTATALSITGGAGGDTFTFTGGDGNLVAVATVADLQASLVTVADFNGAVDVLNIAALGGNQTTQNTVNTAVSGATDLLSAVTAVAGVTANGDFATFAFGGNTYVYAEIGAADGLDAGDALIQLTGVSLSDLTAANFVH